MINPIRSETSSSHVLTMEELGLTLGVIQVRSQNQRNPNAPTFEEKPTEWTLCVEEKARKAVWILHKNVCKVPSSYSGIEIDSSNQKER